MKKRIINIFLSLTLLLSLVCSTSITAFAAWGMHVAADFTVGDQTYTLHGYNVEGYDFYQIKDYAYILKDSAKPFDLQEEFIEDSNTGNNRNKNILLEKNVPFSDEDYTLFEPDTPEKLTIGNTVRFITQNFYFKDGDNLSERYTFSVSQIDSETYMRPADLFQLLDIYAVFEGGEINVDPAKPFTTAFALKNLQTDFFDYLHGAAAGDTEGTYYSSATADQPVAIASTTKIMTYLLVREAVEDGSISLNDTVRVTAEGVRLSKTEDRVLRNLDETMEFSLKDLLDAMLIVSSNEAATLLGEHVAGTEAKFVQMMNDRAEELGLKSARFYNPHGLPVYTPHVFSSKLQNRMNAKDLYSLTCYVLDKYPEILDISGIKETKTITSTAGTEFSYSYSTTNRLMFQMDGVDGLKTGTTNRSGSCLVATMAYNPDPDNDESEEVRFVAVMLGAEDNMERYWKAGILLQYAKECYLEANPIDEPEDIPEQTDEENPDSELEDIIPDDTNGDTSPEVGGDPAGDDPQSDDLFDAGNTDPSEESSQQDEKDGEPDSLNENERISQDDSIAFLIF